MYYNSVAQGDCAMGCCYLVTKLRKKGGEVYGSYADHHFYDTSDCDYPDNAKQPPQLIVGCF